MGKWKQEDVVIQIWPMWDSRAMPSAKDKKPPIPHWWPLGSPRLLEKTSLDFVNHKGETRSWGFGMFKRSAGRTMQNAGGNIQVTRLGRVVGEAGRPGIQSLVVCSHGKLWLAVRWQAYLTELWASSEQPVVFPVKSHHSSSCAITITALLALSLSVPSMGVLQGQGPSFWGTQWVCGQRL